MSTLSVGHVLARGFRLLSFTTLCALSCNFVFAKNDAKKIEKSRFEKLELFNKVLFLIESKYYRSVDTEKLIDGAIKGMMSTLDPHSSFLDEEIFSKMQEDTQGEFGGLGLEVSQKDGTIVVITPIDDTPAFKAGIKPGDKIVEIDNETTLGLGLEDVVDKMRGNANSKIKIGIVRAGVDGIKRFELVREVIKIKAVKADLVEDEFIFLRLSQFQNNSGKQMESALKKLKKEVKSKGGAKGVILDLRSNSGGLLDEAVNISSIFLKDGVVVSTEGRDPKQKEIRYVKKTGYKELELPMVVLINGSSASASEIVAGALQDAKRAMIMGDQSFGKGTVQTVAKIDENTGLKLTIAQYMTPSGRKIQAVGVVPDIFLNEYEAKWSSDNSISGQYIRERDLHNHLNATIETSDEKKERLRFEKEERNKRVAKIREIQKRKQNKGKSASESAEVERKYSPEEDYQVIQAVKFLKSFKIFKKINQV